MPKKAAKSASKCCDSSMKKADSKTGKMPFVPFKKGDSPVAKKAKK